MRLHCRRLRRCGLGPRRRRTGILWRRTRRTPPSGRKTKGRSTAQRQMDTTTSSQGGGGCVDGGDRCRPRGLGGPVRPHNVGGGPRAHACQHMQPQSHTHTHTRSDQRQRRLAKASAQGPIEMALDPLPYGTSGADVYAGVVAGPWQLPPTGLRLDSTSATLSRGAPHPRTTWWRPGQRIGAMARRRSHDLAMDRCAWARARTRTN